MDKPQKHMLSEKNPNTKNHLLYDLYRLGESKK